ncbi:biotin/lipoate A/B protein ligase family protein [Candidatus Hydrogenedentota bacterium]
MQPDEHQRLRILHPYIKRVYKGFVTASANVALDDTLAKAAEESEMFTIRFWSNSLPAVIIGSGQKVAEVVNVDNCREDSVPIVRRFSGGGAVYTDAGTMSFAISLPYSYDERLNGIKSSFQFIGAKVWAALRNIGIQAEFKYPSDIAIGGKKICGNAQRRGKKTLLHHGTLLVESDPAKMERYLKHPPEEPEYRAGRDHAKFVTTLTEQGYLNERTEIKNAFYRIFGVSNESVSLSEDLLEQSTLLTASKYSADEWNLRL